MRRWDELERSVGGGKSKKVMVGGGWVNWGGGGCGLVKVGGGVAGGEAEEVNEKNGSK